MTPETLQVPNAPARLPMAPELPDEFSDEINRLRGIYLQRQFPDFLLVIADEIMKLRRVARAAQGGF